MDFSLLLRYSADRLGARRLFLPAAFVFLLCLPVLAKRPGFGTITGTVLDESGNPVKGAIAYALNFDGTSGLLPQGLTDQTGHFLIRRLSFGRYRVFASKKEEGYPPQDESFYGGLDTPRPEVILSVDRPSETVTLRLGRRGGWVTGSVRDEATGELLETCSVSRWKEDQRAFLGGGGFVSANFRVLIPSDTPVTLRVWEWGYEAWFYRTPSGGDAISLSAGQELHIEIRLKRNQAPREPTEQELKQMKKSMEVTGCGTPEPRDD
jgi:hypothetical protein